ncbi:MAG: NAD(P)H-dependent flavin oxidoreductase [Sedimentitalea sp.]
MTEIPSRIAAFCEREALDVPVLMAPMAGACPVALAAAVANSGGMGACGALLLDPTGIQDWARDMRAASNGAFQMNLWIPDPPAPRDKAVEDRQRQFLAQWGPDVPSDAGDAIGPDFDQQCQAILAAGPAVMSSIMGLFPPMVVDQMKARGIRWYATVTTVAEARAAEIAGADVIVAQGMEAGGHRGAFVADDAPQKLIGLFALLPAVVDAVNLPVVATGGISDARGAAAALILGASAVQIGTGLLRSPEAGIAPVWADALDGLAPEDTQATRAFSGRLGRAVRTPFVTASLTAPPAAPYPVQRGLTSAMRSQAAKEARLDAMQAWAGQSAALARAEPAGRIVTDIWRDTKALLHL